MSIVFVHGACVRDGAWWWGPTGDLLAGRGQPSVAPALPSCGEGGQRPGADGPGLAEDVAAVRSVLETEQGPLTVVAHSYGGIVAAEAAAGLDQVRHLVLISSYLPEPGESLSSFAGAEPAPFLRVDPDAGTFGVQPEMFLETFMHDCPPDIAAASVDHLADQSVAVTQTPVGAAAWRDVPTTYIVCRADRGTPAERQRVFAARATSTVEIDSGHHPFLARPGELADLIADLG